MIAPNGQLELAMDGPLPSALQCEGRDLAALDARAKANHQYIARADLKGLSSWVLTILPVHKYERRKP